MYGPCLEELYPVLKQFTADSIPMSESLDFRSLLEKGLLKARSGHSEQALSTLERGLVAAKRAKKKRWVVHFSRNLGLIYDHLGDLKRAREFYEIARDTSPSDPDIHYALSEVYARLELSGLWRSAIEKCLSSSIASGDNELAGLCRQRIADAQPKSH